MGWAAEDKQTVENAKIALSKTKAEVYVLGRIIKSVRHEEKRAILERHSTALDQALRDIEYQLNR